MSAGDKFLIAMLAVDLGLQDLIDGRPIMAAGFALIAVFNAVVGIVIIARRFPC